MTPSDLTQLLMATLIITALVKRRAVVGFLDDCSDNNVERLIREEDQAMEAGAILAVMGDRRWV